MEHHKNKKNTLAAIQLALALVVPAFAALFPSCSEKSQWHTVEGAVWHTTYRIVYNAPKNLDDSIVRIFSMVEESLSPFKKNSRISRINRNETFETDAMIDSMFAISKQVNTLSNGKFDPTVSPLVNLWGFGYDKDSRKKVSGDNNFTVTREQIDSALMLVGIDSCFVNSGVMSKKHPLTTFNFSAVTKGYACDMVAGMLKRNGSKNHMVEIGGEITLAGYNSQNKNWRIQIDTPVPTDTVSHKALKVIKIPDGGIATSGNYRNFYNTANYGRIGHTINPVTGMPVQTDIASATIFAPSCAMADALATACMASNAREAVSMIESLPGAECLLVTISGDSLRVVTSSGFPD